MKYLISISIFCIEYITPYTIHNNSLLVGFYSLLNTYYIILCFVYLYENYVRSYKKIAEHLKNNIIASW